MRLNLLLLMILVVMEIYNVDCVRIWDILDWFPSWYYFWFFIICLFLHWFDYSYWSFWVVDYVFDIFILFIVNVYNSTSNKYKTHSHFYYSFISSKWRDSLNSFIIRKLIFIFYYFNINMEEEEEFKVC